MAESADTEVDRREFYRVWSDEEPPFPITPLEAWYILQGWAVRPKEPLAMETFLELPGRLEMVDGYIMLRQS